VARTATDRRAVPVPRRPLLPCRQTRGSATTTRFSSLR
jgi:hypothetical protein